MKHISCNRNLLPFYLFFLMLSILLSACGVEGAQPITATLTLPEPCTYPLSEPGFYGVWKQTLEFEDANRQNRSVGLRVWYPADENHDIDFSAAPYPLIVSSAKMGNDLAPYLVTHGFVWAGVTGIDTYPRMNSEMIDQPLDILFALEQMASNPPKDLLGLIDTEHVGAIGYSFDGYNALALSGARLDPDHYLSQCPDPDAITLASTKGGYSAFGCGPANKWDNFSSDAGEAITNSQDGLWQPITDPRIRAVIPMACEGWWLFGEQGLAAVDIPVLMIDGTDDGLYTENTTIFEHLGTQDKTFLSFLNQDHMMIYKGYIKERMAHFAAAFFGVHLQGRDELKAFLSEDLFEQCSDVAWGLTTE